MARGMESQANRLRQQARGGKDTARQYRDNAAQLRGMLNSPPEALEQWKNQPELLRTQERQLNAGIAYYEQMASFFDQWVSELEQKATEAEQRARELRRMAATRK